MDSKVHGERYARIFRKAGVYLAKGNLARALEVFQQGHVLAERNGHHAMARLFAMEVERVKKDAGNPDSGE